MRMNIISTTITSTGKVETKVIAWVEKFRGEEEKYFAEKKEQYLKHLSKEMVGHVMAPSIFIGKFDVKENTNTKLEFVNPDNNQRYILALVGEFFDESTW